jgi:signal transduction histidine kinase/CheY-like chemotaxis protein
MKRFPPPLRFSIPSLIIISGTTVGAISFYRELQDSYRKSETTATISLKASTSQAARMFDYLFRADEKGDQVLTLISQLGSNPDYQSVILYNDSNRVYRSSDYSLVGDPIQVTDAAPYKPIFFSTRQTLQGTIRLSPDRSHLVAIYPILFKPLASELRSSRVGILFINYDLTNARRLAFADALRRALTFNILLLLMGVCIWAFFQFAVTKRMRRLVATSNAFGEGNLDVRSGLGGSDELALISEAFDCMAEKMQQNSVRLNRQVQRELLLRDITERIRTFLELKRIFQIAVDEIRPYLHVDRVAIYKFDQATQCRRGQFIAESLGSCVTSLLAESIEESCFSQQQVKRYLNGRNQIIDDVSTASLAPCYKDLLKRFGIRSNLVVPLIAGFRLWGLFCVHQCARPRGWTDEDLQVINHVASQLSIAIQQADLFSQLEDELQEKKLAEENLLNTNEELARSTRLKDEFLANMSHELRTPLNGILGMAESMQENIYGEISPVQRKALDEISRSGSHLLELINDILDITKIEAGKLEIHLDPVSVHELCQACIATAKPMALAKSIPLSADVEPGMPSCLLDGRLIRQVLINLLSNAVKFTPVAGTVRLQARMIPASAGDPSHATLRISVLDTGIGIDLDDREKVFQPFVQVQSGFNRQFSGTGLGLSIVRRILQAHGGEIELESELGRGSCFTIHLPVQLHGRLSPVESCPASRDAEDPPRIPPSGIAGPQILLAEDNRVNRMVYSRYLSAKGYSVQQVVNGQEAIDFLRHQVPSLLILDMSMPIVDGFQVLSFIRSSDQPQLADLPIISLTALAMKGDREKCLEAGANVYLTKPVKLNLLDLSIKQILEGAVKS